MTTFVVLTGAQDIIQAIQRLYADNHFKYSDSEWFVADEGVTAREVYQKLAVQAPSGEASKSTVVVIAMAGHWGVARKDLWEWLSAKGSALKHASA